MGMRVMAELSGGQGAWLSAVFWAMFWQDVDKASVIRHSKAINRFLGRCWGFMEMASYEKYKPIMEPNHQKYKPQIKTRSVDPSSKVVAMTVRQNGLVIP
jgi:hypothetical protein